ncbi:ATP-binding cassette domain-containing protein [Xenorhabdus bovienii]|uniref:ATP-binding cassette domain-containing protein n=1 Tax=Xenorhabdus bovienii TaxID=40576 RepID=UPI0023B288AC|nr:ATP-binding cassette domain-containing protein [Xenorhabdus bovienii]MDE9459571.1 ATP-binding cassette domain-containing protein [Xenorhabdus bovienii]MDE9515872.1 ATP-binding cassette domain-containing protein [Xenorhabdus bovienii]
MLKKNIFTKYLRLVLMASGLSLVNAAATLYLLHNINALVSKNYSVESNNIFINGMLAMLVLFAASGLMQYFMARLGAGGLSDLRRMLSGQVLFLSYMEFINKRKIIFNALMGDIARIAPLFMLGPQFIYNAILFISCCSYLVYVSPLMFLVFAIGLVLQFINSFFTFKWTRHYSEKMRSSEDDIYNSFSAISDGKKEMLLNAVRRESFTKRTLLPNISKAEKFTNKVYLYWGMNGTWGMIVFYAFLFLVAYFGMDIFHLTDKTVMSFVVGSFFIIGPFTFLMNTGSPVILGLTSIYRLKSMGLLNQRIEDLSTLAESRPPSEPLDRCNLNNWQKISLENVVYHYVDNNEKEVRLGPYHLEINQGEIVFIVGGNGSGKTTLLLLLTSLLKPASGHITIDGVDISEATESYKALFAGVFNESYLFEHVIDAQGQAASESLVNDILNKLGLSNTIYYQNGMLSSLELSTGQRNRVALLQSYLDDRNIYFFDEWAAAQDPEFKCHFYKKLLPELKAKGKTVIAISHDEQYFCCADRLIKLCDGKEA